MPAFAAAHRGLSSEQPENTLRAFGTAVAAGFPALEMDLQLTRDGHVVVLHDATLSRTTDGQGEVEDLDLREVQAFDTGAGPVPTLQEVFGLLKAWGGLYNLEVKAPGALEPTLALAREHAPGRFQVSSMVPGIVLEARDLDAAAPLGLIPLGPVEEEDWEVAQGAGCQWVNVDHDFLDAQAMTEAKARGVRVGAWTVNDPARARELAALGVACVITDTRAVGDAVRPGAAPAPSW
ncbi:MAG TPA: glycerophosphodiester phosphodiesterase family protein [Candidatus Thermoplasmatota archaeon]|nr:glycerophosphodiester phosphodiesterase family protein [Candidatus Thermoplasmatota archaeon]